MKRTLGLLACFLSMTAAPLWAEHMEITEYLNHQAGTMTGSVVSADPNSVVLTADVGQQQTFAIDSRSVVPYEMPAGKRVRVQFKILDSGTYFAQRVTPLEAWDHMDHTMAPMRTEVGSSTTEQTAMETREYHSNEPIAHDYSKSTSTTASETYETTQTQSTTTDNQTPASENQTTTSETTDQDRLPTTASSLPLVGLLASLVLALGGVLWLLRRLRRA